MNKLIGLVVCGGQNAKMGAKDKSMLDYHGKPQRYYLYEMLGTLCEEVYISCNKEQAETIPKEYKTIIDLPDYDEAGDMGALLTAFKKFPKADLLVIGCNYPFINTHHLKRLVNVKLETIPAVSYYDKVNDVFEPMIAVYHNNIKDILRKNLKQDQTSLNKVLQDVDAYRINAKSSDIIKSVNTLKEYKEVAEMFKKYRWDE